MSKRATIEKSSLPGEGDMKQITVGGLNVAVAHVGGAFYVLGDVCTHRGCPLSMGELEDTTVTCPCHGSQFDVTTGAVLKGPASKPVGTYTATVDGGSLQVEV